MDFQEFPKMLYRSLDDWIVVEDAADEAAKRADGYAEVGAAVYAESDEKAALQSKCAAAGVQFDGRWGAAKLKQALEGL